jgi:WG containing repeat
MGFFSILNAIGQTSLNKDILISFFDKEKDEYGYKNLKDETVIPLGKYSFCYTDTFKTYAIVAIPLKGFAAIDRYENVLYNVFPFDNGPDNVSEGLFRILIDEKIGYADSETGKIVIEPQFGCAWPFENGVAKVSTNCKTKSEGEHSIWLSDSWFYIDRKGNKTNQ